MGINDQNEIEKLLSKTLITVSISLKSAFVLFSPRTANKINETIKAGTVDHIKCLICLKRSAPTIADAKLVDSDKGDILSPKTDPETIAPTIKAGFKPNVVPIPKRQFRLLT